MSNTLPQHGTGILPVIKAIRIRARQSVVNGIRPPSGDGGYDFQTAKS